MTVFLKQNTIKYNLIGIFQYLSSLKVNPEFVGSV